MIPLSPISTVVRDPTLVTSSLSGEVVMMDTQSGTYYGLNDTASAIWNLLDRAKSVAIVVDALAEAYEVERSQCERDVLVALEEMRQRGLIGVVD